MTRSGDPSSGTTGARRVAWCCLALLLLLGGYSAGWWYFSERSKAMIVAWIANLPSDRVTVSPGEMRRGGFPFEIRWTFTQPKIDARWAMGEVSARAKTLSLWLEVWRPSKIRFSVARPGSLTGHEPTGRAWRLEMATLSGVAELSVAGGIDVQYAADAAVLDEVDPGEPTEAIRQVGTAATARGGIRRPVSPASPDQPPAQTASVTLEGLSIPKLKDFLVGNTGRAQARLTLRGDVGDGSIEDLVEWRDGGGVLEIEQLDIDWTPVDLAFDGTLALDEQLRPLGAGTADIRGMTELIDKLVERGEIKRSEATFTKLALALLTRPAKDGGGSVVRLPLSAQDGKLRAGPFVLGRLPRLIR